MDSIRLEPPSPFNFHTPDEWPRWKRRFQQFRLASGLSEKGSERQVSTLLYYMGDSTDISDEDKKDFKKVLDKFDEFFKVRRNVIFERARFNRRV